MCLWFESYVFEIDAGKTDIYIYIYMIDDKPLKW